MRQFLNEDSLYINWHQIVLNSENVINNQTYVYTKWIYLHIYTKYY